MTPNSPIPNGLDRRGFILSSSTAIGLGLLGLQRATHAGQEVPQALQSGSYGPLQTDPSQIIDLPRGFTYTAFSSHGQRMDDGFFVPAQHDGMACFPVSSEQCLLIRNHENATNVPPRFGPFGWQNELLSTVPTDKIYDPGTASGVPAYGGTTSILYDLKRRKPIRQWLSLAGTGDNCAGGATPWGTWLSCEEWTQRRDAQHAKDHGYVFEVPATTTIGLCTPKPILGMGRFMHEAVAVDAESGILYLTEDRDDSCLYRFIPKVPGQLHEGGTLQALVIQDQPSFDTRNWTVDGTSNLLIEEELPVTWIDLDNVTAPEDDLRYRAFEAGAARFARGEGIWCTGDSIYWACTTGGNARLGQVFQFFPSRDPAQPDRIKLFLESDAGSLVRNADNLTVASNGDIFLCEDGPESDGITRVTSDGEIERFAINRMNISEFAGACFSPDGQTLFVNIQTPGVTLAINGPWHQPA